MRLSHLFFVYPNKQPKTCHEIDYKHKSLVHYKYYKGSIMRRVLAIITVFALLVSYFIVLSPRIALAEDQVCRVFDVDLRNDTGAAGTATIYFGDVGTGNPLTATKTLTLNPGESGKLRFAAFVPASATIFLGGGPGSLTIVSINSFGETTADSVCGSTGVPMIDDGRINAYDLAAPLAAYCSNGGIAVWHIDGEGQGTLAFTTTADQISAALSTAASSQQNQLVAEGMGDSLYALLSNQIALFGPDVKESGKTYQFIAPGDVCN